LRHRCRTASLTIHLSLSGVHRDSAILEHLDGRGLQDMTNSPIYSASWRSTAIGKVLAA
jgi:hypothetical protein